MLRHLGLIAVCAYVVASVGCDGGPGVTPTPTPTVTPTPAVTPLLTVTVEFGGRVVDADAGGPVEGVRVSVQGVGFSGPYPTGWPLPKDTATSGGDGTFTLPLNLPSSWSGVNLKLTGPPGYDDRSQQFGPATAADRPTIRVYPTLVIRPGESIDVLVDADIRAGCGWDGYPCRRVLVAASPGESVDLEVVSHDSSQPMALSLAVPTGPFFEPDMSVRRIIVPPGSVPVVYSNVTGTATLTARR